jgi:hypothetical protein
MYCFDIPQQAQGIIHLVNKNLLVSEKGKIPFQ